ncbi:hypothetical protein SAMN05519103_01769 [Rhizobiales bacterium GAS113]|nr:hypothetical protein SAMN05519103_01769 [Rhizobiales bacterium GAS113]
MPAPPDAESLYVQLGSLVASMPAFRSDRALSMDDRRWLAGAYALIKFVDPSEASEFKDAWDQMNGNNTRQFHEGRARCIGVVLRACAIAELEAPVSAHGAFIPAGSAFDAFAALSKVLSAAKTDALIIDPYMNEKALISFAVLANEQVAVRLLADAQHVKPSLKPAAQAWTAQHGATRPLEAKLAPARSLHDRLIIADGSDVWVLTQSLNAFAARSPASIVRVDQETAALKIAAYGDIWKAAAPL